MVGDLVLLSAFGSSSVEDGLRTTGLYGRRPILASMIIEIDMLASPLIYDFIMVLIIAFSKPPNYNVKGCSKCLKIHMR